MRCGAPVIVSDRSSLPEVVGDAGLYVDPTSIGDIASQILKVAQDEKLQKQMKEKGFERVKRFSWDETASTIYGAFERGLLQVK